MRHRPSSIETKLPPALREELDSWLTTTFATIEDCVIRLQQRGYSISKSALARYRKKLFESKSSLPSDACLWLSGWAAHHPTAAAKLVEVLSANEELGVSVYLPSEVFRRPQSQPQSKLGE